MSLQQALFGFIKEPARHDIGSNHRAAGVCLKISCWVTFVVALIVAAAGVLFGLLVLVGAAFWDQFVARFDGPPWLADLGAAAGALAFFLILFVTAILVVVLGLFLWWKNHTFHLWNQGAPNALVWTNILAAVMLALSIGGFGNNLSFGFQDGTTSVGILNGTGGDVVSMVLAILILAFANVAASKGELDPPAPPVQAEAGGPGPAESF